MARFLFRRLSARMERRLFGAERAPIRRELDHRQPIALVEPEDRLLDQAYGFVAGISLMGIVALLLILLTWRPACG